MTVPLNQIWAYLHNELAPDDRSRFEQALQDDPDLRKALEEYRITHGELESILPLLDNEITDDLPLEEKLLAEWEAEHPEYAEPPTKKPRRKILEFPRTLIVMAAAAAAIIFLAFPWNPGPVKWQRTIVGPAPRLRGQTDVQPYYTRIELKQIAGELQEAIEIFLGQFPNPSKPWTLGIHLQELANGTLSVEISGSSNQWNENYPSLEEFRKNIPMLGKQVAEKLAEQAGQ